LNSIALILEETKGEVERLSSQTSLQDLEIESLQTDTSRISITSEMMEMMLDETVDSQNEYLPRFQSVHFSQESRRRIVRHCLDLKRYLDKEIIPMSADSNLQKTLFSKSGLNVSTLFGCMRVLRAHL
jgi:hypothetical protein